MTIRDPYNEGLHTFDTTTPRTHTLERRSAAKAIDLEARIWFALILCGCAAAITSMAVSSHLNSSPPICTKEQ